MFCVDLSFGSSLNSFGVSLGRSRSKQTLLASVKIEPVLSVQVKEEQRLEVRVKLEQVG